MATKKKASELIEPTSAETVNAEAIAVVESVPEVEPVEPVSNQAIVPVGDFIPLSVHEIRTMDNARYGWSTNIDIYQDSLKELEESMLIHGFQKEHPISVYRKDDAFYMRDGHRRKMAATLASAKKPLIPNMPQGYVWCVLVDEPAKTLNDGNTEYQIDNSAAVAGIEQINSNKSLSRTPLDCAIVIDRIYEATITKDGKAVTKAAKQKIIESHLGLKKATINFYLQYYKNLDDSIKLWVQASDVSLNADTIKVSFRTIQKVQSWVNQNYYPEKSSDGNVEDSFKKINYGFNEALKLIKKNPDVEDSKLIVAYYGGKSISSKAVCDLIEKQFPIEVKVSKKVDFTPEEIREKVESDFKGETAQNNESDINKDSTMSELSDMVHTHAVDTKTDSTDVATATPKGKDASAQTTVMIESEILKLVTNNASSLILLLRDKSAIANCKINETMADKLADKLDKYQEMNSLEF